MSEELGVLQEQTFAVPAAVRAAVTGDWVAIWIRLSARRLLSYASAGAPGRSAGSGISA
jgi:hypothetical protein